MINSANWRQSFLDALKKSPSAVAVQWDREAWSYELLWHKAHLYVNHLQRSGLVKGDRVAVAMAHEGPSLAILLGHYLTGIIHVPINTRYGTKELEHLLSDCQPKAIWCESGWEGAPLLEGWAQAKGAPLWRSFDTLPEDTFRSELDAASVADEDVAMLIYTSGTTGLSKGCALSYRAVFSNIWHLSTAWQFSSSDKLVLALPLFHVHGLCLALHSALWHSATIRLENRFTPKAVVSHFAENDATVFMGVPTMYHRLLEYMDKHDHAALALSHGRLFTSGSAALSPQHFERFYQATGHRILERYGMSETLLTLSNPYDGERRAGTVGFPVEGTEVSIRDDSGREVGAGQSGTLWVRGTNLMNGYWRNPQATAQEFQEGFFKTGDWVNRDEDGYFKIVGRQSVDILKVGGFKIGAREIEEALEAHEAIMEAAVCGVPDEEWGQSIQAFVVVRPEAELTANTLKSFLQGSIAGYKIPKAFYHVSSLPRNALGKLQKHRLENMRVQAIELRSDD